MRSHLAKGVSLAESIVSIFLLALIFTALFNLIPTTVLANRSGSHRLRAGSLAQSALERTRALPFDDLVVGSTQTLPPRSEGGVTYETTLSVSAPPEGDPDRLKVVSVTVGWVIRQERRTVERELWLHRLVRD